MSVPQLWTSQAMIEAMRASRRGTLPDGVAGLSIDSRTIAAGEAYFAIKGDVHDGHDFVAAALNSGAGLAVGAKAQADKCAPAAPLLVVDDVLAGLINLACASRARLGAQVIAVTGSVGKTSTKEALRRLLGAQGETHASAASYNNHWGVPLSLARCPASARYAVFEIGMNRAGEIAPLTRLARPHVVIVTAVEPVHLEFFGSLDAIADAKAEIFLGVERGIARIVAFGESSRAEARLLKCALQPDGSTVQARILGTDVTYKLGAPGRHLVLNSLAVLAAVALLGADLAL